MPWTPQEAKAHNKKATGQKAKTWSKVANEARNSGKSDASAIRIANSVIGKFVNKHKS